MLFSKATGTVEELQQFYTEHLVKKYSESDLQSVEILAKFIRSGNASCILSAEGGGIFYVPMRKSNVIYIQYVAANSDALILQLVAVAMMDEGAEYCLIDDPDINENLKKVGFHHLSLNFVKPKLAYDKSTRDFALSLWGADRIRTSVLLTFLVEYYKTVAFIPNPENDQTYKQNVRYLEEVGDVIACVV